MPRSRSVLALAGARRIDVLWAGKAGTLALMFSLPMFLGADATAGVWHAFFVLCAWGFAIGGVILGYYAAWHYVPAAREALREGRVSRARLEVEVMKAVILAGGEGTRLRPLTSNQPKPMMPIANVPMMEHIVKLLARHGFDDIVVTVAFMANHIRTYFGDGSELGVRMRYATEEAPLGTAGSVRNAMAELDETFLVISGDVLTDVDLGAIVEQHNARKAFATIALKRVENPVDFGIVITRPDGQIERFLEKPTWGEVFSDTINTGIYSCTSSPTRRGSLRSGMGIRRWPTSSASCDARSATTGCTSSPGSTGSPAAAPSLGAASRPRSRRWRRRRRPCSRPSPASRPSSRPGS